MQSAIILPSMRLLSWRLIVVRKGPLYPTENGTLSVRRLRPSLLGEAYMRELFYSVILTSQRVGLNTLKSFSRCH
jgi:hypothetical protein